MQEKWSSDANERGNFFIHRVPLLVEHQMGLQFDARRIRFKQKLVKTPLAIRLRDRT